MTGRYWIKLWIETLDDPKVAILPDRLWRRWVEILLLAKTEGDEGVLPELRMMAWRLRRSEEEIESDLVELARPGLVEQRNGSWIIPNFAKRQAPTDGAERVRMHRRYGARNVGVTDEKRTAPPEEEEEDRGQKTEAEEEAEEESDGLLRRLEDFGLRRAEGFLKEHGAVRCEDVLDACEYQGKDPAAFVAILRSGEEIPARLLNPERESVRRRYVQGPYADWLQH